MGKCPLCGEWEAFEEVVVKREKKIPSPALSPERLPRTLNKIEEEEKKRVSTGIKELDRILGGGMVPSSLVLVGGEPGIGKSTLLLQAANNLGTKEKPVFYVSGEESLPQIKQRARRLRVDSPWLWFFSETNLEEIITQIEKLNPGVVIIDSIQTIYSDELGSSPGSVVQIREVTAHFMRLGKRKGISFFLIGHVTKEGIIAGPKLLEHIVDTVLYFESTKDFQYRLLRAVKNRFGPTQELGIFEMGEGGLREVENPSELFLQGSAPGTPGIVVVPMVEGSRTFMVEIQALVTPSYYSVPRRMGQGVDYNRLSLLLAVLEKRLGLKFYNQDVFINVAGGLRAEEPASDLGVVLAVISSLKEKAPSPKLAVVGEVGLGGEIRPVPFLERRVREAEKMGFKELITSLPGVRKLEEKKFKLKIKGVKNVGELIDSVFKSTFQKRR